MTPVPLFVDANASMPALPVAHAALARAAAIAGNPSSTHGYGRAARAALDDAKDAIAAAVAARPQDVVLTSGASESNRFVVDALAASGRPLRVVTSPLEHPSLAKPLARAFPDATMLTAAQLRTASPADAALAAADVLVVTAAHNETGVVPDLGRLLALVRDSCLVVVDASQACARLPPPPARVDVITWSAHKIGAFAGAGGLVLRGGARRLPSPWAGGGQEGGRRPGTEALLLHLPFGAASAVVDEVRAAHAALAPLRDRLERALAEAWGARALHSDGPRLSNTSALVVPDVDGDALRLAIDETGVAVGFGAACSGLVPEPSPSLLALGLSPGEARATVRLSLAPNATAQLIDDVTARLRGVVPLLRSRSRAR